MISLRIANPRARARFTQKILKIPFRNPTGSNVIHAFCNQFLQRDTAQPVRADRRWPAHASPQEGAQAPRQLFQSLSSLRILSTQACAKRAYAPSPLSRRWRVDPEVADEALSGDRQRTGHLHGREW